MILVANLSPALQLILGFCWLNWTGFRPDYCGHLLLHGLLFMYFFLLSTKPCGNDFLSLVCH